MAVCLKNRDIGMCYLHTSKGTSGCSIETASLWTQSARAGQLSSLSHLEPNLVAPIPEVEKIAADEILCRTSCFCGVI